MSNMPKIEIARIYDHELEGPADDADRGAADRRDDTVRVLIDRLWPRGVSREQAAIDLWPKDVTPSSELRKTWHADPLGHEPDHFEAFKASYRTELAEEPARSALNQLVDDLSDASHVYLFTAAKTPHVSHAPVIAEALEQAMQQARSKK